MEINTGDNKEMRLAPGQRGKPESSGDHNLETFRCGIRPGTRVSLIEGDVVYTGAVASTRNVRGERRAWGSAEDEQGNELKFKELPLNRLFPENYGH